MRSISQQTLGRSLIVSLFLATLAGSWDAWWHAAVGRDTFWEPPHLLLYSAVILAIAGGAYGWHMFKGAVWKRLAAVLFLIPLSAPFDNVWHIAYGVEDLTSPFVIWSPPHLVLIFSLIGSFALLLPILNQDSDKYAKRVFGSIIFASILALLGLVVGPLEPIGPWHLFGFLGAGFVAFVFTFIVLSAKQWIPGFGGALLVIAFYMILFTAGSSATDEVAPGIELPPHDHPPKWLTVFATLLPASFLEYPRRMPLWLQGVIVSAIWSVLIYGLSSDFLEPEFQYSAINAIAAVVSSLAGGLFAGALVTKCLGSRIK